MVLRVRAIQYQSVLSDLTITDLDLTSFHRAARPPMFLPVRSFLPHTPWCQSSRGNRASAGGSTPLKYTPCCRALEIHCTRGTVEDHYRISQPRGAGTAFVSPGIYIAQYNRNELTHQQPTLQRCLLQPQPLYNLSRSRTSTNPFPFQLASFPWSVPLQSPSSENVHYSGPTRCKVAGILEPTWKVSDCRSSARVMCLMSRT